MIRSLGAKIALLAAAPLIMLSALALFAFSLASLSTSEGLSRLESHRAQSAAAEALGGDMLRDIVTFQQTLYAAILGHKTQLLQGVGVTAPGFALPIQT